MLSPLERRDLLWKAVDQLQDLAQSVAEGEHWPARCRPTGAYVGGYVQRLLAHMIRADDRSSQSELRFLQSYHQDDTTWTEVEQWVLETTAAHPDFAFLVPEFFQAACVHDRSRGTSVALAMLSSILHICDIIIDVDLRVDMREHLLKSEIHSVLVAALEEQHLLP